MFARNLVVLGFVFALPALAVPGAGKKIAAALRRQLTGESARPSVEYIAADRWRLPVAGNEPLVRSQSPAQTEAAAVGLLQHRLRDWGANYMLLESLDQGESGYRFCCKMTSPTGGDVSFEAVGPTAAAAMRQAVAEVAAWRRSGS